MNLDKCERCGKETSCIIMSFFNTQMICFDCKEKEKNHPEYDKAVKKEHKEIKNGNYNFKGIGLPDDLK